MHRATEAMPKRTAAFMLAGLAFGIAAGTPAGLSRTAPAQEKAAVTVAGRSFAFDGSTAMLLRGDHRRAEVAIAHPAPERGPAGRIFVTLLPAAETPEPELWPALVHSRFVEADVSEGPGGLLSRRFRSDGPFPGEILYIARDEAAGFAARCREEAPDDAPSCMTTIRRDGIDMVIRFPRTLLADWARLIRRVETALTDAGRRAVPST